MAVPGFVVVSTGSKKMIQLSASDANGDRLTYRIIAMPSHRFLSGVFPDVVYTPSAEYVGEDSFTFMASDSNQDSLPATVRIKVEVLPDLDISLTSGTEPRGALIRWPSSCTACILEESGDLEPPIVWLAYEGTVTVNGDQTSVTVEPGRSNSRFFRMSHK